MPLVFYIIGKGCSRIKCVGGSGGTYFSPPQIYSNVPQNEDAELVTSEKSKFSIA
jgi:hypothetical protein